MASSNPNSNKSIQEARPSGARETFIYVFTSPDSTSGERARAERSVSDTGDSSAGDRGTPNSADLSLDDMTLEAFNRFSKTFGGDGGRATIHINPGPELFFPLLQAFGIEELPAFGVSNFYLQEAMVSQSVALPPPVPAAWRLWSRKERKRILQGTRTVAKMEREVIAHLKTSDMLFNTVRDIHLAHLKDDMSGAIKKIDAVVHRLGGKKIFGAIHSATTIFKPW